MHDDKCVRVIFQIKSALLNMRLSEKINNPSNFCYFFSTESSKMRPTHLFFQYCYTSGFLFFCCNLLSLFATSTASNHYFLYTSRQMTLKKNVLLQLTLMITMRNLKKLNEMRERMKFFYYDLKTNTLQGFVPSCSSSIEIHLWYVHWTIGHDLLFDLLTTNCIYIDHLDWSCYFWLHGLLK